MTRLNAVADLEQWRKTLAGARSETKRCITICGGTGCRALSSNGVGTALEAELKKQNLESQIDLKITGCPGFCEQGPLVVIQPERVLYVKVAPRDAPDIITSLAQGKTVERLLYKHPQTGERIVHEYDVPFYREQQRVILKNNGIIDPTKIEDYVAAGGYLALVKTLAMKPADVIGEIKRSGLRGRGGAGFSTGTKWELCRQSPGDQKYVICNADEGDPGAFQDRGLIEGNPHSILEGMLIGAYAIGASQGYVYIRHEYPLAVEMIRNAVKQAAEYGLLGKNILGFGFDFDLHIQLGAGAFVCGEETAMMASIEGRVGEPMPRPPFPAEKGLWGKPTNINNTKTWATVSHIINNGAEWYAKLGNEKSKGTTIFSLVGKINNTGLVEVPLGITVRHMIYDIGGGVSNGKKFKAVQTGGPSGGCIPDKLLDLPLDYENLTAAGSMMGSGGMIVMDEGTCMVDVARYFLDFTRFESCGKCTACREGIRQMHTILVNITKGEGKPGDIELLHEMGATIQDGALCALGRTAPNPVLSTIRYFQDEYKAHIEDKKCPAGVCKDLITFYIIAEKCNGCTLCARNCTEQAIAGELHQLHSIDEGKCIRCGICREVCTRDAVGVR
ncbi:MAG: NADH-quinone oxidoreductase subunit NuoF [Chloroflexi bacterium]|nr:NADH-quinone oxidoreductase subunit NuoF [Chloroflexota bacterium]